MTSISRTTGRTAVMREAYAYCTQLAQGHYENFRVVSWLLPRHLREPMYALYAFCRYTDDLGDEAKGDRLALLDAWERDFDQCYGGTPSHPILVALQDVVAQKNIPDSPFRKLIQANRMDQGQVRFATFPDVLHYCAHSANPVGHMVLHLVGRGSPENLALSDATCTALQLANFWQDVRRDYEADRVYLPADDMVRFGCTEDELAARDATPAFRALMRFQVVRTRALFLEGLPLVRQMPGRLRLDVALFSKGGIRVLDAIEAQGYDVLSERPVVSSKRKLWLTASTAVRLALLRRP